MKAAEKLRLKRLHLGWGVVCKAPGNMVLFTLLLTPVEYVGIIGYIKSR